MRRATPEQDDAAYLSLRRGGYKIREIVEIYGVSDWTVKQGIRAARQVEADRARIARLKEQAKIREPEIELWFGSSCKPLKLLTCADVHPNGPIPKGSKGCCAAEHCHQSGMDHHPAMQRNPLTDPKPEPKSRAKSGPKPTRRQRRQTAA